MLLAGSLYLFVFLISLVSASYEAKEKMIFVSVKVHLISILANHLADNRNTPFYKELKELSKALSSYQKTFFREDHMVLFCDDPMEKTEVLDILVAAHQRDTLCPFHKNFDFKVLELFKNGINSIYKTKESEQNLLDIKTGKIRFHNDQINANTYFEYLKNASKKMVLSFVDYLISKKFYAQTNSKSSFYHIVTKYYIVYSQNFKLGSILNYSTAIEAFINIQALMFVSIN